LGIFGIIRQKRIDFTPRFNNELSGKLSNDDGCTHSTMLCIKMILLLTIQKELKRVLPYIL